MAGSALSSNSTSERPSLNTLVKWPPHFPSLIIYFTALPAINNSASSTRLLGAGRTGTLSCLCGSPSIHRTGTELVLSVYQLDERLRPYRALPASGLPNPTWLSSGKARTSFCFMAWLEDSQTRLYIRTSKQGQKSDTVGLAGMRPRQPHHLQPSWSGCCAARVGTTDACEWGEGSRRCPGLAP